MATDNNEMDTEHKHNKRNSGNDVILTRLEYIQRDIDEIKNEVKSNFVTKEEFEPIKKLVYGVVTLILVAFFGALVALVIKG